MKVNLNSNRVVSCPAGLPLWLGVLGCAAASAAAPPSLLAEADIRHDATVSAVEQVMPSVVNIATKNITPVRDPIEQWRRQIYHQRPYDEYYSLGSGVVIDENGYLLTNDHVVRSASQIAVRFGTGTNEYEATVVESDPITDVALLKLKAKPGERFHAIKLAREDDLLLGETVLALGNPLGLGGSVTRGILSSKSRMDPVEGEPLRYPNWLQTDAPINEGNSGGPLVNLRGELIGINVAEASLTPQGRPVQGIGFAIPIKLVEEADIFPTPFVKSFWFGARVRIGSYPLEVVSVQSDSPAAKAGIKVGDQILQVNNQMPKSFIDFADLLYAGARSDIDLSLRRGEEVRDVTVRMVPIESYFNPGLVRKRTGLDLEVVELPPALRFSDDTTKGFLIRSVDAGSPAAAVGFQKGFLIRAVDSQTPTDVTSFAKLLAFTRPGEPVLLDIVAPRQAGIWGTGTVKLYPR
jgi:S1-C subfamily serine protease